MQPRTEIGFAMIIRARVLIAIGVWLLDVSEAIVAGEEYGMCRCKYKGKHP